MLSQMLMFLLETVLGLFSLALLLRFYMQLLRAPYRNPLSQFLIAITDFIVRPARRIIPSFRGMDMPTLVLAWLTELVLLASVLMLQGYNFSSNAGIEGGGMSLLALVEIKTKGMPFVHKNGSSWIFFFNSSPDMPGMLMSESRINGCSSVLFK